LGITSRRFIMAKVSCPFEDCPMETKNYPAMRMHMVNSHDLRKSEAEQILDGKPVAEVMAGIGGSAELQEKLTAAENKTIEDFPAREKAQFVVDFCRSLPAEEKARLAAGIGLPVKTETLVLSEEEKPVPERWIEGKTDKPGYKYYPKLGGSVRE
jgi:hypothetical protein